MQNVVYEQPHEAEPVQVNASQTRINLKFPRSLHGMLKIAQLCLNFICFFTIISASYNSSTTGWLNFVTATAFAINLLFFLLYLFHLISQLPGPWVVMEFAFLTITSFLFLISLIVAAAASAWRDDGRIATALFIAFTGVAFAAECVCRFRVYKEDGQFVISSTSVNTTRRPTTSAEDGLKTQQKNGNYSGQDEYVMP